MIFDVIYRSLAEFARHLQDHRQQGVLLLPIATPPSELQQFQEVTLRVNLPGCKATLIAQVIQVIANLGVAVQLEQVDAAENLVTGIAPSCSAATPQVEVNTDEAALLPSTDEEESDSRDPPGFEYPSTFSASSVSPRLDGVPRGSSPLSWPIEKLQSDWHSLSMADKVRLAKHGKRPARALIMRLQDQQLHSCLLSNPKISPDEVAMLASKGNIHPDLLKHIATSQEWLRHTAIVRNLVCNPKITTPQLAKLINHLPPDELRRLTRTGKVRASVKQLIIRKLDQREGRSKA